MLLRKMFSTISFSLLSSRSIPYLSSSIKRNMSSSSGFEGVWTDWSLGSVLGRSITVTDNHGSYILNAIATFISIVATFAWLIVAYTLHQCLVPKQPSNALCCQHQLTLRNSPTALDAAMDLISNLWQWSPRFAFCCKARRITRPPMASRRRSILLLLIASVLWIAFTVAGIESSTVAIASFQSSNVLAASHNCGLWSYTLSIAGSQSSAQKILNDTLAGRSYARSCYAKETSYDRIISCGFFTIPSLPYTATALEQQCPFGEFQTSRNLNLSFENGECDSLYNYNSGSYYMATHMLDSHDHLGINAAARDRIRFRKVVTCSPLSLKNRTSVGDGPFGSTNCSKKLTAYNFGPLKPPVDTNYTLLYNEGTPQDIVGYQVT